MDALEFLKEQKRMCSSYKDCVGCPAWSDVCELDPGVYLECEPEEKLKIVNEWSASHQRKTRQSVFLEQWPNASVNEYGILFCPKTVNSAHVCYCKDKGCDDCRRDFWGQEVE